jgi:hypothetical protein
MNRRLRQGHRVGGDDRTVRAWSGEPFTGAESPDIGPALIWSRGAKIFRAAVGQFPEDNYSMPFGPLLTPADAVRFDRSVVANEKFAPRSQTAESASADLGSMLRRIGALPSLAG